MLRCWSPSVADKPGAAIFFTIGYRVVGGITDRRRRAGWRCSRQVGHHDGTGEHGSPGAESAIEPVFGGIERQGSSRGLWPVRLYTARRLTPVQIPPIRARGCATGGGTDRRLGALLARRGRRHYVRRVRARSGSRYRFLLDVAVADPGTDLGPRPSRVSIRNPTLSMWPRRSLGTATGR
jgi:hypothetical protein